MSLLNILCPICRRNFQDAEDIYSTSCGHIFHFCCLNDWKSRGSSCPQCRQYNPTTFKLYLSFEEDNENAQREAELKLQKSNDKISQLRMEIVDMENNFMKLQEQFTTVEKEKKNVEFKVKEINHSEENFLKLQAQYTESAELIKKLEDRFNELLIENEYKTREWRLKGLERESYKTNFWTGKLGLSDTVVDQQLWILEQKLKNVTEELKNEICKRSQLAIEKIELEQQVKQLGNDKPKVITNSQNMRKPQEICKLEKQNEIVNKICTTSSSIIQNDRDYEKFSIYIKACPLDLIVFPLENIIINLAAKMQLQITADDLVNVKLLPSNDKESSKTKLSAIFNSQQLRNNFLARKQLLQHHLATRSVVLREFLNDELLELLHYAKAKLQNNGFNHFFYKNGKILAKRTRSHPKVVHIPNKSFVDMLEQKNKT